MALTIKDPETEALAAEIAELTGTTKTGAVREALRQRRRRLRDEQTPEERPEERARRLQRFLETEVWPQLDPAQLGRPITKAEREEILGYGPDGV